MTDKKKKQSSNEMDKFRELIQNVAELPDEKIELVSVYVQGLLLGMSMGRTQRAPK